MRVLIVEDYETLRRSLARGLEESGFAVDATGDGEEGLWMARGHDYGAIILDLMLPGLDGLSILRALRADGSQAPVLILTARGEVSQRVAGLNAGADDYLVKPFAFEELLARVHALVRRGLGEKRPQLELGRLVVDPLTRQATLAGEVVALTPREFALLQLLARKSGEVVSRQQIWDELYDPLTEMQSNVVDVYIGYLRRKLGSAWVLTVRGQGYRLVDGEEG